MKFFSAVLLFVLLLALGLVLGCSAKPTNEGFSTKSMSPEFVKAPAKPAPGGRN